MRRLGVLSSLGLPVLLALAGCQTLGLTSSAPKLLPGEAVQPCPATSVLGDAASVTKLRAGASAGSKAAGDVVLSAVMSRAQLDCNFDREANTLSVNVHFAVRVARGGAAGNGPVPELDYFVAVLDADGNMLVKHLLQGMPDLAGKPTNIYRQNVDDLVVPMTKDKRPPDYQILTGFQLTPQELAYNREPRPLPMARNTQP
jgi:hypothetical protein